jgi:hypothetical protein
MGETTYRPEPGLRLAVAAATVGAVTGVGFFTAFGFLASRPDLF